MNTEPDDITAAERQEFVEALRQLEKENALLRRCVDGVAACRTCQLCAEAATLTLHLIEFDK